MFMRTIRFFDITRSPSFLVFMRSISFLVFT